MKRYSLLLAACLLSVPAVAAEDVPESLDTTLSSAGGGTEAPIQVLPCDPLDTAVYTAPPGMDDPEFNPECVIPL